MAKQLPSTPRLQELARMVASNKPHRTKEVKPTSRNQVFAKETKWASKIRVDSEPVKQRMELESRTPLSEVVADCVKRWFEDTLKEAKGGDTSMQVLVGQMYFSGYGVPRDPQKGRVWINRASKSRSSVWKVCNKPPGHNATDSDSDDLKGVQN